MQAAIESHREAFGSRQNLFTRNARHEEFKQSVESPNFARDELNQMD